MLPDTVSYNGYATAMLPAVLKEHRVLIVCVLAGLVLVEYSWNLLNTSSASIKPDNSPVTALFGSHGRKHWNEKLMGEDQRQLLRAFDSLELSALEAENIALSQHAPIDWGIHNPASDSSPNFVGPVDNLVSLSVVGGKPPEIAQSAVQESSEKIQIYAGSNLRTNNARLSSGSVINSPQPDKQVCPAQPPGLVGLLKIVLRNDSPVPVNSARNASRSQFFQWPQLIAEHEADMFDGGHFRPLACRARQKVALVIPYRDRDQHLRIFINHIIPILKRQQLDFKIYVVEQNGNTEKFNRGMLLNIGFVEALNDYNWQCVIFHDVDLLPENDRNMYMCDDKQPKHLSVAIDKFGYVLPYSFIMGGIEAFPVKTFRDINGFSNLYWGWGGEDDDLSRRIEFHKPEYHLIRQDATVARYKMIKHAHVASEEEPERFKLLNATAKRMRSDGLTTLKYKLLKAEALPLFTKISVEIRMSDYKNKTTKVRRLH